MKQSETIRIVVGMFVFSLFIAVLSSETIGDISYYGASNFLDGTGMTNVELVITFDRPTTSFSFDVIGRIENLNATSPEGSVSCSPVVRGISTVGCTLGPDTNTVQINFQSSDLVKTLGNRYLFTSDYTINQNISHMLVSVKLPEGMALVDEGDGSPGRLTFAGNSTTRSDGRRIVVDWSLSDIERGMPLRFEVFYESLISPFWSQLRIRYFLAFGIATAVVLAFILMRKSKKSEELIASLLDEYERKVMDVIRLADGQVINQRKVVQDTGLSKATVSRVVKGLAERGLIHVERRGRTNLIKEIRKKYDL